VTDSYVRILGFLDQTLCQVRDGVRSVPALQSEGQTSDTGRSDQASKTVEVLV
jgi:hypothetical protein